jgi:hypothetical protein
MKGFPDDVGIYLEVIGGVSTPWCSRGQDSISWKNGVMTGNFGKTAPLLIQERVHTYGEAQESVAHRSELELAETFLEENIIPQGGYDVRGLQQAIRLADEKDNPERPEAP